METGFVEKDGWVLPTSGTIGNKSRNLLNNRTRILERGLKIPRSLTIPWEYLKSTEHPEWFVLEQIDKHFPDWRHVLVRSDAPDEDLRRRFSGQYYSELLWHEDRGPETSDYFIQKVLGSYDRRCAMIRRSRLGLPERGMGLLIQPSVSNSPDRFDADYSGFFSDIGEFSLLGFTNPSMNVNAMQSGPLRKYWVSQKGELESAPETHDDPVIARGLSALAHALPAIDGKGWEIEFLQNKEGLYVVQTTPVDKRGKVIVPDAIDSIFDARVVVGTDERVVDGVLCVPYLGYSISEVLNGSRKIELEKLIEFDASHANYCLVTAHNNISLDDLSPQLLQYVMSPSVVIDLETAFIRSFPPHVEQFMREGRVALAGDFNGKAGFEPRLARLAYSPTRLVVRANEKTQEAHVGLADGEVLDFERV